MDINNMTTQELTNVSCKILNQLPEEQKREVARRVAVYYQEQGFPYFKMTMEEKEDVFKRLQFFDVDNLIIGDQLQQVMLGLNLSNVYHPQMWDVRCRNHKSPMEVFCDLELLEKAIYKRIGLSDTKLQPFNIRKSIKVFGGYGVSNFKPTVAKYIYEKYCPKGGKVLDPCIGYGGRLLGAMASSTVNSYVGCDPEFKQIWGCRNMMKELLPMMKHPMKVLLKHLPFEDYFPPKEDQSVDLVFTSPPYFDTEKYSNDPKQSWVRYPTYPEWREGFLDVLIERSHTFLRSGGYFAINIAGDRLIEDSIKKCTELFGEPKKVEWMRLSKILGSRNGDQFKLEGIYIFQKP